MRERCNNFHVFTIYYNYNTFCNRKIKRKQNYIYLYNKLCIRLFYTCIEIIVLLIQLD